MGRDHVSATVNTLVLAYVGASLPILLIFSAADLGVSDALNLEVVAKEVVATLVGSIGLITAVPITTALALAAERRPRGDEHAPHPVRPHHGRRAAALGAIDGRPTAATRLRAIGGATTSLCVARVHRGRHALPPPGGL